MGFFDAFDNPDFMASLLGVPPTSVPQPQSAPQPQAPEPPAQDPNMLGGANFMPGQQANASRAAGLPISQPPTMGAAPAVVSPAVSPAAPTAPTETAMRDPAEAPAAAPGGIGSDQSNIPWQATPTAIDQSARSVPVPSAVNAGAPQAPAPAPGLASQLGADPQQIGSSVQKGILQGLQPGDKWGQALAAAGKGLSAVGAMRPGATAGQAVAAGLGGSLSGGYEAEQKSKQELFNNSSAAFKELLAAQQSGSKMEVDAARTKLFNSQAEQIMTGHGKNGSSAYQNDPFWKTMKVEDAAQKWEKGQQIILQKQWTLNGTSQEQQQQDLADLKTKSETYRDKLYKSMNLDPKQAQQLLDQDGRDKPHAIDTTAWKGDVLGQFHARVPAGAWYKAKDPVTGKVVIKQRLWGPEGPQGQEQSAAPSPQTSAAVLYNAGQE